MACYMSLLASVLLVAIPMTTAHGGRIRRHGEQFTIPGYSHCLRYMCRYGQVTLEAEGCEVEGQCHNIGSVFEHKCSRYQCTKTSRGQMDLYKPELISTQCMDSSGACRNPGEIFPFVLRGVLHRSCTCRRMAAPNSLRYECSFTYGHGEGRRRRSPVDADTVNTVDVQVELKAAAVPSTKH